MPNSVQTQHTAVMGVATVSAANSALDGSGTIADILTGSTNGTQIKTIIIHSQTNVSLGMLRFFVKKSGGSYVLLREVSIPTVTKSSRDSAYAAVIPFSYILESGEKLSVSTENADTFNVLAEGFDIGYTTTTGFIGDTTEFVAVEGAGTVSTANTNLDGTGSLVQIITAGAAVTYNGCVMESLVVKAQQTTSPGMVRLFYYNGSSGSKILFCEVEIPAVTQGATQQTFQRQVIVGGGLCIPPGSSIWASTEVAEVFSVVANGKNWKYV